MRLIRSVTVFCSVFLFFMTAQAVQMRREPGHRIPEYILPTDRDNPRVWSASSATLTRAAAPGIYATNDIPRTGIIEYPLILVDFIDLPFTLRDTLALLERYEKIFNEQGYTDASVYKHKGITFHGATGSVSDYFRDQSYGQYIPKFKIIGPIHPSKGYAYYGKGTQDSNVNLLIREICRLVIENGLADLSGYASNGTINNLAIIYAGRGENYEDADVNTIWPQTNLLDIDSRNEPVIYKSGIKKIKYACSCELFWDSDSIPDGIGPFCHEFSHTLGLPDFYNTASESESESYASMGFWSVMDYGLYENEGFSPVGYTAFEKYSLGWMDIEEIDYSGIYSINEIGSKPEPEAGIHSAYRLSTGNDDQFIILENHIRTGWYKYQQSQGLMVTAVNYDNNRWVGNTVNNQKNNKRYAILPADNNYVRTTNSGDLFPYKDIDSVTTLGTPVLKAGPSFPLYSIYDIKLENGLVSFQARPDIHSAVESHPYQEISISVTDGELSVTAPTGSKLTVHDISGKTVMETITSATIQNIALPHGIWIIKCGKTVRRIQL